MYGNLESATNASDCLPCPEKTFNNRLGMEACRPCGSSAFSTLGQSKCQCIGQNRAFQVSDGSCTCKSGYIFYDDIDVQKSEGNSDKDCQRIVSHHIYIAFFFCDIASSADWLSSCPKVSLQSVTMHWLSLLRPVLQHTHRHTNAHTTRHHIASHHITSHHATPHHTMHAHTYAYMPTHMDACMHTCMYKCMHACIHTCIYTYMHACMHTYMHECMHACTHACTCTHAHMHAHTHTHARSPAKLLSKNNKKRITVFFLL